MRLSPRPHLSAHRLARLNAWARLWLAWFVGVVASWFAEGRRAHARELDGLARGVAIIVCANAAARLPAKAWVRSRNRHGRVNHVTRRACTGARLRRALRGATYAARLHAILTVMRDLETLAARLARRVRCGLTRLRVIDPKPEFAPPLAQMPASAVACDDSS